MTDGPLSRKAQQLREELTTLRNRARAWLSQVSRQAQQLCEELTTLRNRARRCLSQVERAITTRLTAGRRRAKALVWKIAAALQRDIRSPGSKAKGAILPALMVGGWLAAVLLARNWLEKHGDFASWSVAVATGSLALFTYLLARQAHGQVLVAQNQLVAAQRPMVVPIIPPGWGFTDTTLVLKNVGAGPAYNIHGKIYWGSPDGECGLTPSALGGAAEVVLSVAGHGDVNWGTASGFLRYRDLSEIEWQTHFVFTTPDAGRKYFVDVLMIDRTSELGEPMYESTGWKNPPKRPLPAGGVVA